MEKTKRLLTWVLAMATVLSMALPVFAAENDDVSVDSDIAVEEDSGDASASFLDTINNISYGDYLVGHEGVADGRGEIVINGTDYDPEASTAEVVVAEDVYGYKGEVIQASVNGKVTWKFDVPAAAMYSMRIEYAGVLDRDNIDLSEKTRENAEDGETTSSNVERVIYINGKVPFAETRLVSMKKTWTNAYVDGYVNGSDAVDRPFETDGNGNELRPDVQFVADWESINVTDATTYYSDPFKYYFREGENTISLEGIREPVYIKSITLFVAEEYPTYEEILAEYKDKGYTEADAEAIRIDAEAPSAVSSSTIAPGYDRSSAITDPQHATNIMRNMIGGSSWSTTSDWVRYTFTVEKSGLYQIVTRFKQDSVPGAFVSRALKIDGDYPFDEARFCTFDYAQDWQVSPIGNNDSDFLFYLEEGEHTIELMATVGSYGELLTKVEVIADELNDCYLQIVKLTGAYPDVNRDYGFGRVMPEVIKSLSDCADRIEEILEQIDYLAGGVGSNTANLESAMKTLREMVKSDRSMASNITLMKSHISNLSSWCTDLESQPLQLDFLQIQGESASLPRASAGFMDSMKYEFGQFIGSFYTDYNSFADENDPDAPGEDAPSIEIWMSSGRDRATIIRDLVNSGFCKDEGINVSLKLVDGGALLPSILAGIGPDISLDGVSTIDYAIRGAVLPLNDMTGFSEESGTLNFEEVVGTSEDWAEGNAGRFYASALTGLTLFGEVYGLPTSVDFPMMFVRNDILASLDLEVPETWDDFLALIPVLQYNNMTVIFPGGDYKTFLYQKGGDVWDQTSENIDEWGWRTTFDDNTTLEAFTEMCDMFTQYSLLASADFQTRFKTGVAPVAITSYTSYTALTVFAPEISGLWSMNPIPGTLKEDGTIDNTAVAASGGISMLKGVGDKEATWKFMCWYTDVDFQVDLCNELISLLGPAAKTTTANIDAMAEMPWTAAEEEALMKQYESTVGIPAYPGNYVIDRYAGMAFQNAYNDGDNPAEALLAYVGAANKEISRKRAEFDYPTYENSDQAKEEK